MVWHEACSGTFVLEIYLLFGTDEIFPQSPKGLEQMNDFRDVFDTTRLVMLVLSHVVLRTYADGARALISTQVRIVAVSIGQV